MTPAEADDKPQSRRRASFQLTRSAKKSASPPPAATDVNNSDSPPPTRIKARKAPGRSETSPELSDETKWREALPFLGRHRPKIFDKYKILRAVGTGQFGTVFAVKERHPALASGPRDDVTETNETATTARFVSDQNEGALRTYACKVVDIIAHGPSTTDGCRVPDANSSNLGCRLEDVMNEVDLLHHCGNHPNVLDIIDFEVEDKKAYIVSSLCRGGDLVEALNMRGSLCEEDARNVMAGILNGLAHLHSRGVVHRDIKLENILLADSKYDMTKVKIIDMGLAKRMPPAACKSKLCCVDDGGEALHEVCGTPLYLAPELVRHTVETKMFQSKALYGTKADIWSCGIILYCLLSGYHPFQYFSSIMELFEDIQNAEYEFSDPVWETVSAEALDMIRCLLEADPKKRLTAEEALRHPWMVAGR